MTIPDAELPEQIEKRMSLAKPQYGYTSMAALLKDARELLRIAKSRAQPPSSPNTQDQDAEKQAFEAYPKLAGMIENLGWKANVSIGTWGAFLAELNDVLKSRQPHVTLTEEDRAIVEAAREYYCGKSRTGHTAAMVRIIDRICLTKTEGK